MADTPSQSSANDPAFESQQWLHEAIDRIPKPLFFVNRETQRIWFSNEAARKMLGVRYEDEWGTAFSSGKVTISSVEGRVLDPSEFPSRRALAGETINGEEYLVSTRTGRYHIRAYVEQIPAVQGQPQSAIILLQDISALKAAEAELRKTQSDLHEAIEISQVGFWSLDTLTGAVSVSPLLMQQFGIDPNGFGGSLDETLEKIHKDDVERVRAAIGKSSVDGTLYHIEYRVVRPSGEVRWIEAKGGLREGESGLKSRFSGTTVDITETVKSRQEIESARRVAELASQTKSQFLANMSHEIRTPLGAIMGFASLLKDPSLSRDQYDSFVAVIERNSNQLLRIIDDILDLSKVEAGMLLIERISFSLPELLTDFSSLMGLKAREKGIGFSSRALTALPKMITTDPTRLRQILANVVGNAIKFTDQGNVELRVCYREGMLEFEIQDSGRGISREQAQILFQPFTQADSSITRKYGGTGLGLALSRSLAEALGGNFELKQSELGVGSTFIVRVQAVVEEGVDFATGFGFETVPPVTVASLGELAEMKVLLVEDSPDNQALISIFLGRAGARIDIASDGAQGLMMALAKPYDIVLMDVQMPVMDGITAIKKLRDQGYNTPVIALTAHAMKEERVRCIQAGFTDFLSKPVKRADLVTALNKYRKK